MPNLQTYDHERQPRDLHFNIDEGIQALAVDGARICNRKRYAFGSGTLRNLGWFEVEQMRGAIKDSKVQRYQVTLKVGFTLE